MAGMRAQNGSNFNTEM